MSEASSSKRPEGEGESSFNRSVIDRRSGLDQPIDFSDRRGSGDRRDGIDGRDPSGLKRLRGPGRRRPEFNRAAEEGEFSGEQFLFVAAIDAFKRANNKSFPTWTEVLEVIRRLGYRKTMPCEINLSNASDWTEEPDAPAFASDEGSDDG